jgi:hypothetical protein
LLISRDTAVTKFPELRLWSLVTVALSQKPNDRALVNNRIREMMVQLEFTCSKDVIEYMKRDLIWIDALQDTQAIILREEIDNDLPRTH